MFAVWFLLAAALCCVHAQDQEKKLVDRLLKPAVRAVLRRRANRVIDELNTRLPLRIPSFKLTKREILVDQLRFDPKVLEAAEKRLVEIFRAHGLPG